MRFVASLALVSVVLSLGSFGCAHSTARVRTTQARVDFVEEEPSGASVGVATPPSESSSAPSPNRPRARLSQTVTLGQGTNEAIYAPLLSTGERAATAPGVVVNNNITVMSPPPAYGGYYGYGLGGGIVGGGGFGVREPSRGTSSRQAWAPNGWEGARRTAAPGHTPNVGGNWSLPPSHGPSQMK